MNALARSIVVAVAAGGLLAGCATYDYGYSYGPPSPYYYGYGPYYYGYDYGPYYYGYDYGPYYYGVPYYAPSVGFGFTYHDHDHHYAHSERRHTSYNGTHRYGAHGTRSIAQPTVTHSPSRNAATARSHPRPVAPAPTAHRGYAPNSLVQSEQQ